MTGSASPHSGIYGAIITSTLRVGDIPKPASCMHACMYVCTYLPTPYPVLRFSLLRTSSITAHTRINSEAPERISLDCRQGFIVFGNSEIRNPDNPFKTVQRSLRQLKPDEKREEEKNSSCRANINEPLHEETSSGPRNCCLSLRIHPCLFSCGLNPS